MSRIEPELVATAQRHEQGERERAYLLEYALCRDIVPSGDSFYYIKCYLETRQAGSLIGADLEIADGLGTDAVMASTVFSHITGAMAPLFPNHLKDVVRDVVVAYRVDAENGGLTVACAAPPQQR